MQVSGILTSHIVFPRTVDKNQSVSEIINCVCFLNLWFLSKFVPTYESVIDKELDEMQDHLILSFTCIKYFIIFLPKWGRRHLGEHQNRSPIQHPENVIITNQVDQVAQAVTRKGESCQLLVQSAVRF